MRRVPDFPPGAPVVAWFTIPPSSTPRDPRETVVDHVGSRGDFTVTGVDATFRPDGHARPVRGKGAFAPAWVAVPADSDEARQVLGEARRRAAEDAAVEAVQQWLVTRDQVSLRRAVEAMEKLEEET